MDEVMAGAAPLALTSRPTEASQPQAEPLSVLSVAGLSYQHPGGARGIADISITLRRGDFTVITGQVGSGKTTLLRCLLGLLQADVGDICWNGETIYDPAAFMVPPRCAYTPQAPRLFSESLRDNIAMGFAATEADFAEATRLAVLNRDIERLQGGLDTLVGSRGVTLSGGQIQRAAAARMLVRGAELLVLDDLSSALDIETERQLWQGLAAVPGLTCLAVSHRRAAFERASEIIVMDDGRVAARGTYQELLRGSALFARTWGERD
jgi:ATP-binding cassette, subfamily B, bacterial